MLWIALYFPDLTHATSPSKLELTALAAWAGRFTPNVSLERDCGLLLEIESSLRLFGSLQELIDTARGDLAAMAYTVHIAAAPTARAAWWLARTRTERLVANAAELANAITELPVAVLGDGNDTLQKFAAIGARTLGDVLGLPRDGLARRFGQPLLNELDRALGRLTEPRCFFVPPARFRARLELAAETQEAPTLVFAAKRLLIQLGGFLAAGTSGVDRFTFKLFHRRGIATRVTTGLAARSRDAAHFTWLLRERLERLTLDEPVCAIALAANDIAPLAADNLSLFRDAVSAASEWPRLVEQLRARLGDDSIHGLAIAAEHRPERASITPEFGAPSRAAGFGLRPMWLLAEPQPLAEIGGNPQYRGPLQLLSGAERIESGWWDGDFIARDYFIAQTTDQALLWVYRQAASRWYLHGLFA
jgi:protein ImuB